LERYREQLLDELAAVQLEISTRKRSVIMPTNNIRAQQEIPRAIDVQKTPATPYSSSPSLASTNAASSTSEPFDKELNMALGLLLKHRGGPGFGHGRLENKELEAMENKLRSVSAKLLEEAVNGQAV
jgi:hypothetical protein